MNGIRYYGPAVVLALTMGAALLFGPSVMRRMAYADQAAKIEVADRQLADSVLTQINEAFRNVAAKVKPSVVHIRVERKRGSLSEEDERLEELRRRFNFPRRLEPRDEEDEELREYDVPLPYGNGSGWVYDRKGHIVTNYHVVKNADVIKVTFHDKSVHKAKVVGADSKTDIAVIKLESSKAVHPAGVAEQKVRQGDIVFAFGSPFGESFSFSMSQGIVSGKGRELGILNEFDTQTGRLTAGYEDFIQTDAAINPGNSGGPLTNVYGQVVGMNTAIASRTGGYQGIGFAIPAEMISRYVPQLIEAGAVKRGYLGVAISDDPKLLKSFGVEQGVVIDGLLEDGPAADAGLKAGDIIVEVGEEKIRDAAHLRQVIADMGPDVESNLVVLRDGKRLKRKVTLAELPSSPGAQLGDADDEQAEAPDEEDAQKMMPLRKLGLERVRTLTERYAEDQQLPHLEGVLIERVRRGSVVAAEGVRPGMLITEVTGQAVENVDELVDAIEDADLNDGVRLRIAVLSNEGWAQHYVVLELPD